MNKKQIAKAMKVWRALEASRDRPCIDSQKTEWFDHLAEHLAAVLPPTVDDLVEVFKDYRKHNGRVYCIKQFADGTGSVRDLNDNYHLGWPVWNDSKDAIAAIKDAMTPEPTAAERFDRLVKSMGERATVVMVSDEELRDIIAIRKALEAE